jgi:hypothetical protein
MADNYLITGYCGKPHVTAENDRGINAGIVGKGKFVLPVGEQFRAEYIGNNTVRMYDGKLMDNGVAAGIPAGEYIDFAIRNASQGMKRNDLIVFEYHQDPDTLIESGNFYLYQGSATSGTPTDPNIEENDLLSGRADFDQMALWRIHVSSGTIHDPEPVFELSKSLDKTGVGIPIVTATSSDGVTYIANVDDVEEYYAGLTVTIIPNRVSASTTPRLIINGLGGVSILHPLSSNTATSLPSSDAAWMAANKPVTVQHNGQYWLTGIPVLDPIDLNGSVPVKKGGTGLASVTAGNFLVGNGEGTMQEKTPAEVLSHIGALRFDLLWQNASPSSSFAGQTITVPGLAQYDFALIVASHGGSIMCNDGIKHAIMDGEYGSSGLFIRLREITITGESVSFDNCGALSVINSNEVYSQEGNKFCIPHFIYGLRGLNKEGT